MMKNLTKVFALAIVMIGFTVTANAQSATATGVVANATIIAPITISAGTALSFGDIVASVGTAGTVVLATDGTRNATTASASASTLGSASSFTVTGETGYTYTIALPTSISLTGTGAPMTVNAFTSDQPSNVGTLTGGTQTFLVGATLAVGAAQVSGAYAGTYDVTVTYN